MAMYTVIVKNSSGSDQAVADLGITVPDSSQEDFEEQFTFPEIAGSDDLRALVNSGDLVINDGSADLSAADGEAYLTLTVDEELADEHYTKTEMQTSGQSQLHWDNVTNAPSFGGGSWINPVEYIVLDISSAAPGSPSTGDVYIDTDDDHYYKWSGSWVDQGAATAEDRVINLNNADEDVYVFVSGTTWTEQSQEDDGATVMVKDDGDGGEAQYAYDTTGSSWTKIADVDFGGHLDGGTGKHDASEIDVEGTYTYIATGGLEAAIEDVDDELGNINTAIGALTNNTLDEAYDQGGAGVGRTITADTGPVKINATTGTYAPLELQPQSANPSSGLADGQVCVRDGIACIYDNTRSKWLSVQRMFIAFGRKGKTRNQMLNLYGGRIPSNKAGLRMIRNGTIVGISGQLDASGTCDFYIRKNDTATNQVTQALAAAVGGQTGTTNVDFSAGDFFQAYLNAASRVNSPMCVVEIAWRP